MKKSHLIIIFFLSIIYLSSCKDKMICPAFQSSYILDDEERTKFFSLFGEDSLPKMVFVKKDKHGIAKKISYRKRVNKLRTVKMENIYPKKKQFDSMQLAEQDLMAMEGTGLDTLSEATNPNPMKYNIDQENYMRLFGQYLVVPEEKKEVSEEAVDKTEKRGLFGFLKKRKKKDDIVDTTANQNVVEEVDEFTTSDEITGGGEEEEQPVAEKKETKKEKKKREKLERKKKKKEAANKKEVEESGDETIEENTEESAPVKEKAPESVEEEDSSSDEDSESQPDDEQ